MYPAPSPGAIARVRQRLYLVEDIVAPTTADDSTLVRLSCIDDDNQGQPLDVLWERELDPAILTGEAWEAIATRGFDSPSLFAAYLHTLRWNCVTATDPRLFQAPFRAGIRLDAYQLEPLRKALLLPRVNLFIADDVGLGKTIEAGLIARELLLRKKVREIVVACPPSMLLQWHEELETRFGLSFVILDKEYLKRVRRERGFQRQSLEYASARPRLASLTDRRSLYVDRCVTGSAHSAVARCSSWMKPTMQPLRAASATPSTRRSPAPCATWPHGSSTGCSCRPRRTTGTPTASRRSWKSSTRSASAAGSPSLHSTAMR